MSMQIVLKEWKVVEKKDLGKTIAGTFAVRSGSKEVAKQEFNDGYNAMSIPLSAKLLVEAEELGEKVKVEIEKSFN